MHSILDNTAWMSRTFNSTFDQSACQPGLSTSNIEHFSLEPHGDRINYCRIGSQDTAADSPITNCNGPGTGALIPSIDDFLVVHRMTPQRGLDTKQSIAWLKSAVNEFQPKDRPVA